MYRPHRAPSTSCTVPRRAPSLGAQLQHLPRPLSRAGTARTPLCTPPWVAHRPPSHHASAGAAAARTSSLVARSHGTHTAVHAPPCTIPRRAPSPSRPVPVAHRPRRAPSPSRTGSVEHRPRRAPSIGARSCGTHPIPCHAQVRHARRTAVGRAPSCTVPRCAPSPIAHRPSARVAAARTPSPVTRRHGTHAAVHALPWVVHCPPSCTVRRRAPSPVAYRPRRVPSPVAHCPVPPPLVWLRACPPIVPPPLAVLV
ncbi:hypothetical protein PLICRDRAFT_171939 [Plicaturopsis crispa FD-325 SS-3]|nr:hypothetical protein PLICRDRAFT_171939 [Plicaturopsis crispa FD-325 SS-3]